MKPKSTLRSFFILVGSSLLAISSASAVNWTNTTTGTQQWNTVGNWDAPVPNASGAVANLSVNLGAAQTVNLASGVTLGSLTYGDSTTGFVAQTIQGSAITFNNSGSGATLTQASASGAAPGNIASNIVLNDNLTIFNNGTSADRNNAMQLTGVISGTGGIILNSTGGIGAVQSTNANNTYSGGVTFIHTSAKFVTYYNGAAFGTGTITFNAAGVVDTSSSGSAALLLTTNNAGVWNINWNLNGFWNNNGNVTLGASVSVGRGSHLSLGGNIGETGGVRSLTLTGNASSVFNGTNTYTGGTTVSAGSLAFLKTASMPSTGNVSFANGTTLGIGLGGDGWTSTGTGPGTLAGIFQGTNVGVGPGSSTFSYGTTLGLNLIVTGNHSFGVIENLRDGSASPFTKSGLGTLTMNGDNTYTGATIVQGGGGLILDYGTSDTSKFTSTTALTLGGGGNTSTGTLGGGTITLKGGTFTEIVSATSLNTGHTAIARDTGTAKLRLNAITRAAGGTVSFADATIAQTDTNHFGTLGANGVLGGWATLGNDWAASADTGAADTAITALASYTPFVNNVGSATTNYLLNGTDTLTGAVAAGTLKITDSGASQSLTLGNFNLNVTSASATALGGIMYAGGTTGSYTINGGGTGRIASSTANSELIFAVQTGTLTVNAIIFGNSPITKSGAGTLVLGGTNTGNGFYYINEGALRLNSAAASGVAGNFGGLATFVQSGAALELTGGFSFTDQERVMISGTGVSNGGALRSISGANTWRGLVEIGVGGARINNDSADLFTINNGITTIAGGDVTFGGTGNTTVTARTTDFRFESHAINGGGGLIMDGAGTLTLSGRNNYTGNSVVSSGTLVLADNAQLRFILGTTSGTNNSLTGAGTATLNGDFTIDTSAADSLVSGSWTLENVSILTGGAYGTTFTVIGFTDAGSDNWTKVVGPKTYTYNETSGILTLTSGAGSPEINVNQGGDIANGGSKSLGTVTLGSNTSPVFAINNTGTAALNLTGTAPDYVAVSGANASDFIVTAQPTTPVTSGGGTTNFTVQFTPSGAGLRNATLTILNNDSDEGTFTINVSGTGQTLYDAWSGGANFDLDANNDGVKNGLAWLLGAADVNANAIALLPTIDNTDPTHFIFTYRRKDDANNPLYTTIAAQYSTNLTGWTTAVDDADIDIVETDNHYSSSPGVDRVVVKLKRSTLAPDGKLFVRLSAVKVP